MSKIKIMKGDCLKLMPKLKSRSVNLILCDLPYGTTALKWDSIIPIEPLWEEYKRIITPRGVIALFGIQPFTSFLICSNFAMYRYNWVWEKNRQSNFQLAKVQPLRYSEDICIFSKGKSANGAKTKAIYYPQKTKKDKRVWGGDPNKNKTKSRLLNANSMTGTGKWYTHSYPSNILRFNVPSNKNRFHPVQKPVDLLEYLIKTYTRKNQTVLDNCMGSGSTGVAAVNLHRNFIGMEQNTKHFNTAKSRIAKAKRKRR
jgi:site-specific DNA-methyltransferase (adenine-specific)